MTSEENLINNHIGNHMERIAEAAPAFSSALPAAAETIVNSFLSEGQVLVCGNGKANALAQFFCSSLLSHYEVDRPSLPAINIGGDGTTFSSICMNQQLQEVFSRQIQALGREGDTLLLITDDGSKSTMVQALQAAHDRQMRVIALTGKQETDIHSLLHADDIELPLSNVSSGEAAEIMIVALNAMVALIEGMLFGGGQETA